MPALIAALFASHAASAAEPRAVARAGIPKPKAAHLALPFIEDDYAAALREARARDIPIFIESWAPW